MPILQSLQQLLNNKDIASNMLTRHSDKVSQFTSFKDGKYFKLNEFFSDEELRISLILYVDDFEICNPLGISHKTQSDSHVLGTCRSALRVEIPININ